MSHIPVDNMKLQDASLDAFGRIRTSEPYTLFDSKQTYGNEEGQYYTTTAGSGAATFLGDESSFEMSVTTASGDRVLRRTYEYFNYLPGKSHLIICTGILGPSKPGVIQRIGYYDDNDGIFFQQSENGPAVVRRTSTSGSPIEEIVLQANWNIDKMDGSGPSGVIIDFTKVQIFVFDMQWLGSGRVRASLEIGGTSYTVHEFNSANTLTEVYMKSADLPISYEIENISTSASATSMKHICSTVISEGGYSPRGSVFSFFTGTTPIPILATNTLIANFRLQDPYQGQKNRSAAFLLDIQILPTASSRPVIVEFIQNPTIVLPTWTPHTISTSSMEIDTTGITTGGNVRYQLLATDRTNATIVTSDDLKITPGTVFSIQARALATLPDVWIIVNWREIN